MEMLSSWLSCRGRFETPEAYVRSTKIIIVQGEKTTNPTNCMQVETLGVIMQKRFCQGLK